MCTITCIFLLFSWCEHTTNAQHHTILHFVGPVWQVSWAHPKFGNLLASCSYDSKVIIWKEASPNNWGKIVDFSSSSSVNSVAWAPHTFGLVLAAACSDGTVSIFTHQSHNNTWDHKSVFAHKGGVNAVSWGPDMKSGSLLKNQPDGMGK